MPEQSSEKREVGGSVSFGWVRRLLEYELYGAFCLAFNPVAKGVVLPFKPKLRRAVGAE